MATSYDALKTTEGLETFLATTELNPTVSGEIISSLGSITPPVLKFLNDAKTITGADVKGQDVVFINPDGATPITITGGLGTANALVFTTNENVTLTLGAIDKSVGFKGIVSTNGGSDTITIHSNAVDAAGNPINVAVFSGDGADTVTTTAGRDVVALGAGDDKAFTGKGADVVTGGVGKDTINTGRGADSVSGGADDDTIFSGDGADFVLAGDGNDIVTAGLGADNIVGGAGNDTMYGGQGFDRIDGGAGSDSLVGGRGQDTILTGFGDGIDTVSAGFGNDKVIVQGAGADVSAGLGDDVVRISNLFSGNLVTTDTDATLRGEDGVDKLNLRELTDGSGVTTITSVESLNADSSSLLITLDIGGNIAKVQVDNFESFVYDTNVNDVLVDPNFDSGEHVVVIKNVGVAEFLSFNFANVFPE